MKYNTLQCAILAILLATSTTVTSKDSALIPEDPTQLPGWFQTNVQPYSQRRGTGTLNSTLEAAEANPKTIRLRKDGSGDFTTLTDAINSVPVGNTQRMIIDIGPGVYVEKVKLDADKPFITLLGSPANMPTLSFNGTAAEYGTFFSATLDVESEFFVAANVIFQNSAPRGVLSGGQDVALRISGDYGAFYNCRFLGFQDTLLDEHGKHFYNDCYIEGTVDFIFGNAKSIYLGTETHAFSETGTSVITAQGRKTATEDTGFSFVHCSVTGVGSGVLLGRVWMPMSRVVFAYSQMSSVVDPAGWSDNSESELDEGLFFGEFHNTGPGANVSRRIKYFKPLTPQEVTPYITLSFIQGSLWLLPPPNQSFNNSEVNPGFLTFSESTGLSDQITGQIGSFIIIILLLYNNL